MIQAIIGFVLGIPAGAIGAYFFLKNNPKKAAVANAAVNAVDSAAKSVVTAVSSAVK